MKENGSGKFTMFEALATNLGFNQEGGTKNYYLSTYDSHSELCDSIRISKRFRQPGWGYFLRAESFYNVAKKKRNMLRMYPLWTIIKKYMVKAFWKLT